MIGAPQARSTHPPLGRALRFSFSGSTLREIETALYPLWVGFGRMSTVMGQVAAEFPLSLYSPQVSDAITRRFYAREPRYRDLERWRRVLFPFEMRMLERFFPAPPARILLHGAGSGRELTGLRALGYKVTAFEPVRALVDAANRSLDPRDSPIRCAALQDWDRWKAGPYGAVFTGWGVWTHLILEQDRLQVLKNFREVCPIGPVLLSFFNGHKFFDEHERGDTLPPIHQPPQGTLQKMTRYWLRQRILRMPPLERGTGWNGRFYYHGVHRSELKEEAKKTGWRVAYFEGNALRFPHAVLVPEPSL